jgi:hypothetical protein
MFLIHLSWTYITTGSMRQPGVEGSTSVGHKCVTSHCSHTPFVSTEYHTVQDAVQNLSQPHTAVTQITSICAIVI